jgi:lipopolysaccharide biosynthesis glycosyltransferase
MQESGSISIVAVCDNHYSILLCTLIKSIQINHKSDEKIDFFIVEDGITEGNKRKVEKSINDNRIVLHWMPMKNCIPKNVKLPVDKSNLPMNIFARLFIPHFVPDSVNKVIYFDVDMIVLVDISRLWNTDINDQIIGVVQDQFIHTVSHWGGVSNYEELGIPSDKKYFNSGLMIIDTKKWKSRDITDKVILCIEKYSKLSQFSDQYGLNAILYDDWYPLDPLWNTFSYSEEAKPFLIHFTGRKPIYKTYNYSDNYRKIFYNYLNQTEWSNFRPIGETTRYLKKASNMIEKIIRTIKP